MKKLAQIVALLLLLLVAFWSPADPAPTAKSMPFTGPGINTHGQLLPVHRLKAIGIRWVRGDWEARELTQERVKAFLKHYKGLPCLITLQQKTPNAPAVARNLVQWGATDLELGNEPERPEFSPDGTAWDGARYGRWFASVHKAVGGRARLYGPATGVWLPEFTAAAVRAGMRADFLSWHGYGRTLSGVKGVYTEARAMFGRESINTEIGFGVGENYPVKLHPADAYIAAKKAFGNRPWCYYDGPNGNADKRVGLFEWNGKDWSTVTDTYRRILELVEHPW